MTGQETGKPGFEVSLQKSHTPFKTVQHSIWYMNDTVGGEQFIDEGWNLLIPEFFHNFKGKSF